MTTPAIADHSPSFTDSWRSRLPQAARDLGYLLISWPFMLAGFILVVVLLSLGVGLSVLVIGVPLMVLGLGVARGIAELERGQVARLTGVPRALRPYREAPADASALRRSANPLFDPQSWRDVAWLFGGVLVSSLTWPIALTWVVGSLAMIAGPLTTLLMERVSPNEHTGLAELLQLPGATTIEVLVQFGMGLVFVASAPWVLSWAARLQTSFSEMLLSKDARHQAEVTALQTSRAAVREAEADALRRLERDIHDGPQQRLVRLNMDLARARRQSASDPLKAQALIDDAMQQTQETLAELRQLSRGIAPPILVDRGLEAALSEAAARSTVPVTVYSGLPAQGTLPAHAETAAYFVASEALANLNKHSQATQAELIAGVQDGWLFVTVNDNGLGGADTAKGHGLTGLERRLQGVDGQLTITSPVGGPTSVEAAIPCA